MKKKVILIIMACFAIITCQSQTEKGKILVGALLNFSMSNTTNYDTSYVSNTNKNYQISINPYYGYFIKENLAIGIRLKYLKNYSESNKTDNIGFSTNSTQNNITYQGGIFVRYYTKITGNLMFVTNGDLAYSYETDKSENLQIPSTIDNKITKYSISITPGLVYFISPKFGLETTFGSLNYSYSTTKDMTSTVDNQLMSYL